MLHLTRNGLVRRHKLGTPFVDPLSDPFAETVLDYAYNLVAGGLLGEDCRLHLVGSRAGLFERLVEANRGCLPKRRRSTGERESERLEAGLRALVRQRKGKPRSPAEPRPPVPRNLDMASEMLGLSDVERAVLQFLITLDPRQLSRRSLSRPMHRN